MTTRTADYPGSVWDGLSSSRLSRGTYARPSPEDYDQTVAELIATQTELDAIKTKLASTTLTSAQLLACFTTPITIIPAQGVGLAIIVEQVVAKLNYGTATYAWTTVGNLSYTDETGAIAHELAAAFLEATADAIMAGASTLLTGDAAGTRVVEDAPIVFGAPDANPITGDGTLTLAVRYRVVEL